MTTATQRYFYIVFALLFAVGMHYYQYNFGGFGLQLPFNLIAWSLLSILIGISLWNISLTKKIIYSNLLVATLIFAATLFIPPLYNNNDLINVSSGRLLGLIGGALFLFCLYQINLNRKTTSNLASWIIIAVLIESIIAIYQKYFAFIEPVGVFQQRNVASTFFVSGIALCAYLIAKIDENQPKHQALIYLTSYLAAWVVILIGSKTATISLFIVLASTAPLLYKRSPTNSLRLWYFFLIAGLSTPLLANIADHNFVPREIVDHHRPAIYSISYHIFNTNWLAGTGYGSFESVFLKAQANYHNFVNINLPWVYNLEHPHNEILLWAIEGGVLTTISIFAYLTFVLIKLANRGWRELLFYFGILFPISFHTQTELPFYHAAILWISLLTCLYIMDREAPHKSIRIYKTKLHFTPKIAAIIIPLIVCSFMMTGIYNVTMINKYAKSEISQEELASSIVNTYQLSPNLRFELLIKPILLANTKESTLEFISKTEALLKAHPREKFYQALIEAYYKSSNFTKLKLTCQELYKLYPPQAKNGKVQELQLPLNDITAQMCNLKNFS
ncbi:PglL family O-oligosaccharyltransferase [Shewanella marisflavi]|uniref:Virulence factor membrane-bound polymerase C-terminal domain-containing protein n=1 Tax=Shewanella marisflavi TaxID=260364 RepID=A0AAC9U3H8_9GAMM|nr:Wzy polymerase domain-containing protein [Shewanella marisflavi]ASJ98127.1 hypothetical protein CFF01_16855 [Shewanella marisflavi]